MKQILGMFALLPAFCFSLPANAIKTHHTRPDADYFNFGQDPRFKAVGYLSTQEGDISAACTATLVHSRVIQTAAHCVPNRPESSSDQKGDKPSPSKRRAFFSLEPTGEGDLRNAAEVETFIIHPRYNPRTAANDLALGTLSRPITTTPPLHIFGGDPNVFLNQTVYAVGYGEAGNAMDRHKLTKDAKKRAMATTLNRYDSKHGRLEADFFYPTNSTLPHGTLGHGDSGGALIGTFDGVDCLIGSASTVFYDPKNLPDGPVKSVLTSLDSLPDTVKKHLDIESLRNLLYSDLYQHIGYGGTNRWISIADHLRTFLSPAMPHYEAVAHRGGDWDDTKIWSNSGGKIPNNMVAPTKDAATYFNAVLERQTLLSTTVSIDVLRLSKATASLTILPQGTLKTVATVVEQGVLGVAGNLETESLVVKKDAILCGTGVIRLYDPSAQKMSYDNYGTLNALAHEQPFIIEGDYIHHKGALLSLQISSKHQAEVMIDGEVTLEEGGLLKVEIENLANPNGPYEWTILTGKKITGSFSRMDISLPPALEEKGLVPILKRETNNDDVSLVLVLKKS